LARILAKVGGSLLDLPDLAMRLQSWHAQLPTKDVLLFPGGGRAADVVRNLDRVHRLGEEAAHWLAVRSLSLSAYVLGNLLGWEVVEDPNIWREHGGQAVVDPLPWLMRDESDPGHCPHRWEVTSDSLALRLGQALGVDAFYLLKSTALPAKVDWPEAGRLGLVDAYFSELWESAIALDVRWINLRAPT